MELVQYLSDLFIVLKHLCIFGQITQRQTRQFLNVLVLVMEDYIDQKIEQFFSGELYFKDRIVFGQRWQIHTYVFGQINAFRLQQFHDFLHDVLENILFVRL